MRTTGQLLLALAGLLLASTAALAQVGGTPGAPAGEPPVETPVEPPPETTPPVDDTPEATVSASASTIPGKTIGIGTGYVLPADVTIPNAASVRFRLASGLTFEALVRLSWEGTTVESTTDPPPPITPATTDSDGLLTLQVAALVRKPLATRGRFQFVLVVGAGVGFSSNTDDPDGANNSTTDTVTTLAATWGFGIDWFFRAGWSFSLTAANPLLALTRIHDDGLFNNQTITSVEIGAIYDPTISAMFHLYY